MQLNNDFGGLMSTEISQLKKWLSVPGNSMIGLAAKLKYQSATAIYQWIKRNHIPHYRRDRVLEIINGKRGKNATK